jgi:hypothetical protein
MKRTGVVNTRELVNELRLEITEVKHAMSEIVNSLSSIAQPVALKASDDVQVQLHESIQRLRCDMDNFCQKIDASLQSFIDQQAELNRFMSIRNEASLDLQEKKLQGLEERIMQLRDEIKKQSQ